MADKHPSLATKPGDPKDVAWGLTTADTCWRRGERSEALRWLRRAVEAASEAEADERALELAKVAADLATQIGSMAPPPPAAPNRAAHHVQSMPAVPRAPAVPSRPTPPKAGPPLAPKPLAAKDAPKKADRKSLTSEGPRSKPSHAQAARSHERPHDEEATSMDALPPPRKRSTSKADRGEAAPKVSRTDEIDAWPTEVVTGQLTREPPPAVAASSGALSVVATQAVRVLVWREANGVVQVAAPGAVSAAPAGAVEATLVASDATDLLSLLRS